MYRRREIKKYVIRKNKQSKTAGFVDSLELSLELSRSEPSIDQEAVGLAEQGWSQRSREPLELIQFINATHQRLEARRNSSLTVFNSLASSHSITSVAACSLASWECVDGSFDIQSIDDGDLLWPRTNSKPVGLGLSSADNAEEEIRHWTSSGQNNYLCNSAKRRYAAPYSEQGRKKADSETGTDLSLDCNSAVNNKW